MHHLSLVLLALALVLLNGFFVAAEFSIVKLRHTRLQALKERYGFKGHILDKVHQHLDSYLSACQLGITLASLALGWIGEPAFATLITPLLSLVGVTSATWITTISFIGAFLCISSLHIIVGEMAPKSLAIRRTDLIAVWSAVPLYYFHQITYPIIWLLNSSAICLLNVFGVTENEEDNNKYSADELKLIISTSHSHGELAQAEMEIIENTLELADLKAADLMHPVDEMVSVKLSDPIEKTINTIVQNRYTRYPVFHENDRDIAGIIHMKDLFVKLHQSNKIQNIEPMMRPILSVTPELPVIDLFRQFKNGYSHFAVIHNEHEMIIGYVTLDNILGALLGNIHDEFNQVKDSWITLSHGSFLMKGNSTIYALEKALDIEIDDADIHTISGLITNKLERLPSPKEHIEFEKFNITIRKMQGPQILLVKVTSSQPAASTQSEHSDLKTKLLIDKQAQSVDGVPRL